jgi:hypothetical protein
MDANSILTSTFYDKRWASNTLMRSYELEYEDGTIEERIDYSDWRFTSLLKRIRTSTPYPYNGFEKFTTLVYKAYGNTTIYRLILMYNGFMHPYEIKAGTQINLPDPEELNILLRKMSTKKENTTASRSVPI